MKLNCLLSLCVLQKVCVLQYSSDSVQKSVGPNYDVQKHDAVVLPEVLPGCVALRVVGEILEKLNWACTDLLLYFCPDDGEQVMVDVEGKDHKQIAQHVKKILGKSE